MIKKKRVAEYELIEKFMQWLKKPTIAETIRLNRYIGLGMYREWKKIEFQKMY